MKNPVIRRCGNPTASLFAVVFLALSLQAAPSLADSELQAPGTSTAAAGDEGAPVVDRVTTLHIQATAVPQGRPAINSPYESTASLVGRAESNTSFSSTIFMGVRPLPNTDIFVNPEFIAGGGISNAYGLGAYPNGEINRVGNAGLSANLARAYISQTIPLGGELEAVADDQNTIAGHRAGRYLRLSAGKFSLADFLDSNAYGHDQRTQFLNWCFMDNCAWDFSMNPYGYTYGAVAELVQDGWAIRLVGVTEPTQVNGGSMDWDLGQAHSLNLELERGYKIAGHPGKVRLLGYQNRSLALPYDVALSEAVAGQVDPIGVPSTVAGMYHSKTGGGIGVEQELSEDIGVFFRAGMNDGGTESWTFTEADRTLAGGVSLNGRIWKRASDTFGLGVGANGLSAAHTAFLAGGGQGLMLGDGALTYAPEEFTEIYYSFAIPGVKGLLLTPDFQFIANPGFNSDRGPATVIAARLHYDWGWN